MVTKLVVLIFACFFIQNEACTKLLQRLQQISQTGIPLRRMGQTPLASPSNTLTTQTAPTRISSRPSENDLPGTNLAPSNNLNPQQNRSPYTRVTDDMQPLNYARSTEDWTNPDLLFSSTMKYRNPSNSNSPSSAWNTRLFNAAYRYPRRTSDQPNYSSDDVSSENSVTNANPRSLASVLPGIMNAGTGLLPSLANPLSLGSSVSRIPSDLTRGVSSSLSDVTQGVTSSISSLTPGALTSALTSLPNKASNLSSSVTSALSPSNYLPTSTWSSSIPGLIYLASSFANWMNSNSTLSSTRSALSSYNFLSYIPGLLSAISVIAAPFLPSFLTPSQFTPPTSRSSLSSITSLPSSLLGLTGLTSGDRNRPYGYENNDSGRGEKSRVRPNRENGYYGNDFDHENDSNNEYADEKDDYRYGSRVDDRHQQARKRPSSSQRIRNAQKSSVGPHRRGDRNRNPYNHEDEY